MWYVVVKFTFLPLHMHTYLFGDKIVLNQWRYCMIYINTQKRSFNVPFWHLKTGCLMWCWKVYFFNIWCKIVMPSLTVLYSSVISVSVIQSFQRPWWPRGHKVWHLITNCHLCVASTNIGGTVEGLSEYDPGCWTGCKTLNLTFDPINLRYNKIL